MPDFGSFRGFGEKLTQGQTPTQLGTIGSLIVYDGDAQAFFNRVTAAGGTLSLTEIFALNQLVLDFKSAGIWTSMKAIYPMVGASAAACAQNLKSSSFTGTFLGGWTFSSSGATPNGTSGYMRTGVIPSASLSLNSAHLSCYINFTLSTNQFLMGSSNGSTQAIYIANYGFAAVNNGNEGATNVINQLGLFTNSRTASNAFSQLKNGSALNNFTTTSTGLNGQEIYVGSYNFGGTLINPSVSRTAFSSIGDGLTNGQVATMYTAIQTFQTSLSRQV
jgi:hypothetical protein